VRIIREGGNVFVVGPGTGHAFDMKAIRRVTVENMRALYGLDQDDEVYVSIWTGSGNASQMCVPTADARQMFRGTPWALLMEEVS
jgi:hypothetical protein